MPAQTKNALLCALTVLTLALAGCAEPEETGEPVGDEPVGDEPVGDDQAPTQPGPQYVTLGEFTFECDDTITTNDVCEEYTYMEEPPADAQMAQGTLNEDGTATIEGNTYECDDTVNLVADGPECEEWLIASEA